MCPWPPVFFLKLPSFLLIPHTSSDVAPCDHSVLPCLPKLALNSYTSQDLLWFLLYLEMACALVEIVFMLLSPAQVLPSLWSLPKPRFLLEDQWVSPLCFHTRKVKVKSLSRVQLLATPWTAAHQAPLSMGFSRQGHWSGLPFPSPGESSQPRDRTQVSHIAGRCFTSEPPGKPLSLFLSLIPGWFPDLAEH